MSVTDTIFALSTGVGQAGLAVIRISGPKTQELVGAFTGRLPQSKLLLLSDIRDPEDKYCLLDRAMVVWRPGPATATGEDLAEFHIHGSQAVIDSILKRLGRVDHVRMAEAGEFTARAFRNGKMDLLEVEGLSDLLNAKTERQQKQALTHLTGVASGQFDSWLEQLIILRARWEALIDFAEEDNILEAADIDLHQKTADLIASFENSLRLAEQADVTRSGVYVALLGAPNVGKSSLLNQLAGRPAAIVSHRPGTTRDVVEVSLVLAGLPVVIADTAGLRPDTDDDIEQIGIARSRERARTAHIILAISAPESDVPEFETSALVLSVFNKSDLLTDARTDLRRKDSLEVSAKTGQGIDELIALLEQQIKVLSATVEAPVAVRERHRRALRHSIRHLNESLSYKNGQWEFGAEAVRQACQAMASATGRIDVEQILGHIFAEFCIGK